MEQIGTYSVNKLIELVKARPTIWDSSRKDFRCFYNKEVAWIEVYEALDEKYRTLSVKNKAIIGDKITAKWRNIRDTFIRSVKKRKKDKTVKKYMHHDRMSFMLKLLNDDDIERSPHRRHSTNYDSTTEHPAEGIVSYEDSYAEDPLVTVIKAESDKESTIYNNLLSTDIKVEPLDEPTNSNNLKRKAVDLDDVIEESRTLKVRRLETELQIQPIQTEHSAQALSPNDNYTNMNTVRVVNNVQPSAPYADESFFASITPLVRDMTEDEKLEFRMAVLQLIYETRLKRRKFEMYQKF